MERNQGLTAAYVYMRGGKKVINLQIQSYESFVHYLVKWLK